MYLLAYSILISSVLILAIFVVNYLTDRQLIPTQKTKPVDLNYNGTDKNGLKCITIKERGLLGKLSIGIQEY